MILEVKKRYDSLDILKGISIFMVVWGHLIDSENILFRYLNNIHLPVFFIISGYLLAGSLSRYPCECVFKKKFLHLFIPFLSWSIVSLMLKAAIKIKSNSLSLKMFCTIFSEVFIYANSAWFLWILFLGSCLVIFYEKINKRKYLFWLFILGMYLTVPNDILKLGKLKIMFPIFFLGFLINKKNGERWLNNKIFRGGNYFQRMYFRRFVFYLQ